MIEALDHPGRHQTPLGVLDIRGPAAVHRTSLHNKRVWRVYGQLRLNLPRRTKPRLLTRAAQPLVVLPHPNAVWALDFMRDTLHGGRRFWMFNILDEGVREVSLGH